MNLPRPFSGLAASSGALCCAALGVSVSLSLHYTHTIRCLAEQRAEVSQASAETMAP